MELLVNGEALDVKLEQEKTAYDIVESFQSQLENKMIIASLTLNDKYYAVDDDYLKSFPVENITTLHFEVCTREELAIALLEEVKNSLANIAFDLKENAFAHIREYENIFQWIVETIETINRVSVFQLAEARLIVSTIAQIREYLKSPEKETDKIGSLSNILENLTQYLTSMQEKIAANFAVDGNKLLQGIESGLGLLPEISEDFQLGRDKDALSKVHMIINLLEMCSLYIYNNLKQMPEDVQEDASSIHSDLNGLLADIVEGFENGDFVLIGDLLEYELPEKLQSYKALISDLERD